MLHPIGAATMHVGLDIVIIQAESVRMLWATYGGQRGAVKRICEALDGHWTPAQMSRVLRDLGLMVRPCLISTVVSIVTNNRPGAQGQAYTEGGCIG